jgi:hypothetical protein
MNVITNNTPNFEFNPSWIFQTKNLSVQHNTPCVNLDLLKNIEKLSRLVSLSILDIFSDTNKSFPAYLIAGLISDLTWSDYNKANMHIRDNAGNLKTLNKRINDLQKWMNDFVFTTLSEYPQQFPDYYYGDDPWGYTSLADDEIRLGKDIIEKLKSGNERGLKHIAKYKPSNQFAKILDEPLYKMGYYPRFRNELIEAMYAYNIDTEKGKRGSGKCVALLMAAMTTAIAYFKIPYENVCIIVSANHVIAFIELDNNKYCIWNNRVRYVNDTIAQVEKIKSEIAPKIQGIEQNYFFYPAFGICNFEEGVSNVSKDRVYSTISKLEQFVGVEVKFQNNNSMKWLDEATDFIPDPNKFSNVEEYRRKIYELAEQMPFSIYDYSKYAYRDIHVIHPQAYIVAAKRDFHVNEKVKNIKSLEDAFNVIKSIPSNESIFKSRDRIALPDEVLFFKKGNDRDRALLLYCLLSNLINEKTSELLIGFSQDESYVKCCDFWINSMTFELSKNQPFDLQIIFNENNKLL